MYLEQAVTIMSDPGRLAAAKKGLLEPYKKVDRMLVLVETTTTCQRSSRSRSSSRNVHISKSNKSSRPYLPLVISFCVPINQY
jgi:hypothetical protein